MKGRCPRKDEKENDARKKSALEMNAQPVGGADRGDGHGDDDDHGHGHAAEADSRDKG
jgi:hypothetical protein